MKRNLKLGIIGVAITLITVGSVVGIFLFRGNDNNNPTIKSLNMELVGSNNHGSLNALDISDNRIFVSDGNFITVLDSGDPSDLIKLGEINVYDYVYNIKVYNNTMIAFAGDNNLISFDITDISDIKKLTNLTIGEYIQGIYVDVDRDLLYVSYIQSDFFAGFIDEIKVFDISDPSIFDEISTIKMDNVRNIAVKGDYIYIISSGYDRVYMYDVSNPSNPSEFKVFNPGYTDLVYMEVDPLSNTIYVLANWGQDLVSMDTTNSQVLDSINHASGSMEKIITYIDGGETRLLIVQNDIWIIDASVPSNLVELDDEYKQGFHGGIDVSSNATSIYIAYANSTHVSTLDITNPSSSLSTVILDQYTNLLIDSRYIKVIDDIAYVIDSSLGFMALNITDLNDIVCLDIYSGSSFKQIEIINNNAFIIGNSKILILNITDPTNITLRNVINRACNAFSIEGIFLYMTISYQDIFVYNIADIDSISQVGNYDNIDSSFYLYDCDVKNGYVFEIGNKLRIINATNPSSISELKNLTGGYHVKVSGDLLVGASSTELSLYNISDITNPISTCNYTYKSSLDDFRIQSIQIHDDYLYVSASKDVVILDITDWADPIVVGYYYVNNTSYDTYYDEESGLIFTVGGYSNLFVFEHDVDEDNLYSQNETMHFASPYSNDTDNDGMDDYWEVVNELYPSIDDAYNDKDFDLLLNIYEYLNGTDPNTNDTDGDGVTDFMEIYNGTDPLSSKSDIPGIDITTLLLITTMAALTIIHQNKKHLQLK